MVRRRPRRVEGAIRTRGRRDRRRFGPSWGVLRRATSKRSPSPNGCSRSRVSCCLTRLAESTSGTKTELYRLIRPKPTPVGPVFHSTEIPEASYLPTRVRILCGRIARRASRRSDCPKRSSCAALGSRSGDRRAARRWWAPNRYFAGLQAPPLRLLSAWRERGIS